MRLRIPAFCILAGVVACSGIIPATGGSTTTASSTTAADVIRFTNDARYRNGLALLGSSAKLMEAARIQAEQMARAQTLNHSVSGSAYPTLESRLQAATYIYSSAAENIAWNQTSAQAVVNSWLSSSGHRANIMDKGFKEIGAAMAHSAKGEAYWVEVFGSPR